MIQEEEEVAAVDNLANETEVVENQVKDMPESNSSEYNDKPTLIGQTFVGLYAGIFGWVSDKRELRECMNINQ